MFITSIPSFSRQVFLAVVEGPIIVLLEQRIFMLGVLERRAHAVLEGVLMLRNLPIVFPQVPGPYIFGNGRLGQLAVVLLAAFSRFFPEFQSQSFST